MEEKVLKCSFLDHFSKVEDYRNNPTYPLIEIIVVTICAVICGATDWTHIEEFGKARLDWLRDRLGLELEFGIPSHDTFSRVFACLDPDILAKAFFDWIQAVCKSLDGDIIPIDGKTVRRSFDKGDNKGAIHLVNAFSHKNGVCLGQVKVDDKSNEITAIPKLLELLIIKGAIVTIDAIGTQTEIAEIIIKAEADYVLSLKDNQETLCESVKDFFEQGLVNNFQNIDHDKYRSLDKDHGRIEERICYVVAVKKYSDVLVNTEKWAGLKSIVLVKSKVIIVQTGEIKTENRYFISSLELDAKKILRAVRAHWNIENCLHWTLDVVFHEDDSRMRVGDEPENFSIIRKIALNYLRNEKTAKVGVKGKQLKAALDVQYLETVLNLL